MNIKNNAISLCLTVICLIGVGIVFNNTFKETETVELPPCEPIVEDNYKSNYDYLQLTGNAVTKAAKEYQMYYPVAIKPRTTEDKLRDTQYDLDKANDKIEELELKIAELEAKANK